MANEIGKREGRYQQGDHPDLCNQYKAIGISAVNAAAPYLGRPKRPPEQQSQSSTQFLEFED